MAHPKGESFVSHTKTLLMGGFCPSATKPLAKDWRGVWGVVEALLRQGGFVFSERARNEHYLLVLFEKDKKKFFFLFLFS